MSFPASSVGLVFAIVETLGGFLNFASEPIVQWVAESEIDNFYYVTIGSFWNQFEDKETPQETLCFFV